MLRPVDLGNPVNRGASLNLGLAHWYRGLPNNRGSRTIFDLCKSSNFTIADGTGYAAAMWSPKHARCDFSPVGGVSPAYYGSSDSNLADFSGGFTASAWIFPVDVSTYNVVAGVTSTGVTNGFYFGQNGAGLILNASPGAVQQWVGPNIAAYSPSFAVWVCSGGAVRLYVDSIEVQNFGGGYSSPAGTSWYIGNSAYGYGTNGGIGSLRFYTRGLTASEIVALYEEELAGCPTTLNRYTPRTLFLGTSSATAYTTSTTGSATGSGALRRTVSKSHAGSTALTGALAKSFAKPLSGAVTGTGAVRKQAAKPAGGSSTGTGTEAHSAGKSLTGSSTGAGAAAKSAAKPLTGASTAAGTKANAVSKSAAGGCTSTGAEANATSKALGGSATASGSPAKTAAKTATGSTTPRGEASSNMGKGLAGATAATGTTSSAVGKAANGSTSPAGSLANAAGKRLAGSTTPSGVFAGVRSTLLAASGAVTAAGSLVRSIAKYLVGLVTGGGSFSTEGGTPAPADKPGGTFSRPVLLRAFSRAAIGRVFRCPANTRVFARERLARTFHRPQLARTWRYTSMPNTIPAQTIAKAVGDDRYYICDLSKCPEIAAGATVASAVIEGGDGLTIGSPVVLAEAMDGVAAGKGVKVRISGGTDDETVSLACKATLSTGSVIVVPVKIAVAADYE